MAHYSTVTGKHVHRRVCISASSLSVEKELYQFPLVGLRTRGCYHTCISIAASPTALTTISFFCSLEFNVTVSFIR